MNDDKQPTHQQDHEGAEESAEPGEPDSREVIKPGWADLEETSNDNSEIAPEKTSDPRNKQT
ncbi:MAG: hypothetical protein ABI051_07750 [Vicinamibacterales bacterium]